MLYLVKSYFPLGKFIYKIGFSEDSNIKIRLDKYFYTSPGSEVISLRQGDEVLEDLIHYYLYYLGYRYQKNGRLDEWFIGNSEVLSIFHISRESLERAISHFDGKFELMSNKVNECHSTLLETTQDSLDIIRGEVQKTNTFLYRLFITIGLSLAFFSAFVGLIEWQLSHIK